MLVSKKKQVEKLRDGLKPYVFQPQRITDLLDEKLMNIATLAEIAGMNRAGLARVLSGVNIPMADTLGKIAAALGVNPGHFFIK